MIKTFSEYLKANGKVLKDPPVEKVPEYKGSIPTKPDQGKGSEPYSAPGKSGKHKPKDDKSGLVHKGPKNLKYTPDTKVPAKVGEGGKKLPSYPKVGDAPRPKKGKLKTEEFLDATRDMSTSEFAAHMAESIKAGDMSTAHPIQYVKYTAALIRENGNIAASLIMEAKRRGVLSLLVYEAMQHQEGLATVVDMLGDSEVGPSFRRRMDRMIAEEIAPPAFDDGADGGGESEIPTDPQNAGGEDAPKPGSEEDPTDPNNPPVDAEEDEASPGDEQEPEEPHPAGTVVSGGEPEEEYEPQSSYNTDLDDNNAPHNYNAHRGL